MSSEVTTRPTNITIVTRWIMSNFLVLVVGFINIWEILRVSFQISFGKACYNETRARFHAFRNVNIKFVDTIQLNRGTGSFLQQTKMNFVKLYSVSP